MKVVILIYLLAKWALVFKIISQIIITIKIISILQEFLVNKHTVQKIYPIMNKIIISIKIFKIQKL